MLLKLFCDENEDKSNSEFWSIRSIFVMDLELLNFELLNGCSVFHWFEGRKGKFSVVSFPVLLCCLVVVFPPIFSSLSASPAAFAVSTATVTAACWCEDWMPAIE